MIRMFVIALLLGIYVAGANDPSLDGPGSPIAVLAGSHARLGARQARSTGPLDQAAARAALDRVLESSEGVVLSAPAVGSTLFITDRRLVVVRDGARYRPSSGIKSWPLDRELTLRFGRVHRDTSQLIIGRAGRTISVFVTAAQLSDVQALVAESRRRIYGDAGG
jgi:hypothetical protein